MSQKIQEKGFKEGPRETSKKGYEKRFKEQDDKMKAFMGKIISLVDKIAKSASSREPKSIPVSILESNPIRISKHVPNLVPEPKKKPPSPKPKDSQSISSPNKSFVAPSPDKDCAKVSSHYANKKKSTVVESKKFEGSKDIPKSL